ncbi:hypothetical protein [Frateuria sp. Soil773]|uniref:hypothetical protein n=1 Tax=Frateuria sp. Soil773 TaxID=1736407 RepID=UPI001F2440F1|nr:hypothetical protein [Frateuria sp. Soil773]
MRDLAMEQAWEGDVMDMTLRCPKCGSTHVETRDRARRFGGALGAIAGTTSGVVLAVSGAEIGLLAGPVGALLGAAAGVVIEGIVGGAAGCAAGARLGTAIDRNILHNYRCDSCGHAYGGKST